MTYALILVRGVSEKREQTLDMLNQFKKNQEFHYSGIKIVEIFISFGWPDIILLLKGRNVEQLKNTIVDLRDRLSSSHGDNVETSTIICTTPDDLNKIRIKKKGDNNTI